MHRTTRTKTARKKCERLGKKRVGYLLPDELPDMADTKFWQPIKWAMEYVRAARAEGLVASDNAVQDIYQVTHRWRSS